MNSGCLGPHEFTLVFHLSPTLVSHSGFLGPHESTLVFPLSPTLGSLGRMNLHLSSPCLPHLSSTLVFHSGCLGPHEFTLVSHLSPTLVFHTCLPLWVPWAASCLPHLSPITNCGAVGHAQLTKTCRLLQLRLYVNCVTVDLQALMPCLYIAGKNMEIGQCV